MIRCNECLSATARIVTGSELTKLSKKSFEQALAAGAVTIAAVPSTTATLGVLGAVGVAAKAAATAASPLAKVAIVAATAIVSGMVTYGFERIKAGSKQYVYCSKCGHQEPLKGG
jgi:polyferredoxin